MDAMSAEIQGKAGAWDKAVQTAREEWRGKGVENPDDRTPGYTDRINGIYRDILEKGQ
jgi:hypothetical protein